MSTASTKTKGRVTYVDFGDRGQLTITGVRVPRPVPEPGPGPSPRRIMLRVQSGTVAARDSTTVSMTALPGTPAAKKLRDRLVALVEQLDRGATHSASASKALRLDLPLGDLLPDLSVAAAVAPVRRNARKTRAG